MSQLREPAFDRIVALVLRVGAFGCFFIMVAGLTANLFVHGRIPLGIERAGVLLMLATPVVRVIVACFLFGFYLFGVDAGLSWMVDKLFRAAGVVS